jgi:outer membrane receptor for Fe3+-dicitrate
MSSKTIFALGTAFAAIALCCFVQSSFAQDAVVASIAESETEDADDSDDCDDKSHRRRSRRTATRVNTNSRFLISSSESLSLGVTSFSETAEVEGVVVTGTWFDAYPVPYPALPPVEGTRINAGKKTSFVKPAEFPTFAGNDYREVMATTPGILVSEEPQSPIINFGYRGLNSQRSEFMQVLEDGISLKNEQFGFPETHYTPILDAVERIELIRAGAALQYGCQL